MKESHTHILTVNGGSSSIKFALFETAAIQKILEGKIDRIGMEGTYLVVRDIRTNGETKKSLDDTDVISYFMETLTSYVPKDTLVGIGHRVVHGGTKYFEPTRIDATVMAELEKLAPFAPRHLPSEITLIRACLEKFSDVPQFACFDTSFYRDLPRIAQILPLPREHEAMGVRRYGFHGLSYEFLLGRLEELTNISPHTKKIVFVHLGSGTSLTAVQNGIPVETTMGFTPTSGVPMGTRSGDLDPGLFEYFTQILGFTPEAFNHLVNYESGLLGVSGITADMEILLREAPHDTRAEEAVAFFCYHVRKSIGALAATMNGIDTLVFSGGMGEKSAEIRERICVGLQFLGIEIDTNANDQHTLCISIPESRVALYMIPTNEEYMIAQHVHRGLERPK